MTRIIKKNLSKEAIDAILRELYSYKKFDAKKYCGVIQLKQSPLEIQKNLRDEWE